MGFIINNNNTISFQVGITQDKFIDFFLNLFLIGNPSDKDLNGNYNTHTLGWQGNLITSNSNEIPIGSILPHLRNTILIDGKKEEIKTNIDDILQSCKRNQFINEYKDLNIKIDYIKNKYIISFSIIRNNISNDYSFYL